VEHAPAEGEPWRGFAAATELTGVAQGIVMVALPGHTRGHAAVAVDAGDRWILHAGDAFFHHGAIDGTGRIPLSLRVMERAVAHDWSAVRDNHARLAELRARADADLTVVCAHDPATLPQPVPAG
jgi:glyoxylase-like metal-dependent hydrolase (beta-lactamase superfamily II)